MKHISRTKIISAVIFFTLSSVCVAQAAEIRVNTDKVNIQSKEQFLADVIVSSEESLNAVEGRLIFPHDLLSIKEIRDGGSVINFWVEKPHIERAGIILFSGITPGGFSGVNSLIFSVVFEAKATGIASVAFQDVKTLKNDGLGTEIELSIRNTTISIKPGDGDARTETLIDTELPEDFNPSVESDPNIFAGKYFLVFVAQDKMLGIDHYEVREGEWGFFREAVSPYLLKYQSLNKKIFVKAIDRAGNERVAVLNARQRAPWYQSYPILGIILVTVAIVFLLKLGCRKLGCRM